MGRALTVVLPPSSRSIRTPRIHAFVLCIPIKPFGCNPMAFFYKGSQPLREPKTLAAKKLEFGLASFCVTWEAFYASHSRLNSTFLAALKK